MYSNFDGLFLILRDTMETGLSSSDSFFVSYLYKNIKIIRLIINRVFVLLEIKQKLSTFNKYIIAYNKICFKHIVQSILLDS